MLSLHSSDSMLISPLQLRSLCREDLVLLDARAPVGNPRGGYEQYLRGHIPTARWLSWDEALHEPDGITPGRLPLTRRIATALARAGVTPRTKIVVYDDNHQFTAAQLVWILRAYGCREAQRLDGGWPAWVAVGGEVETGPGAPHLTPPGAATGPALATAAGPERVGIAELSRHLEAGGPVFDCRRDSSWEAEPFLIPSAMRLPVRLLLDGAGGLLPAEKRTSVAEARGAARCEPLVVYCAAAISASAVWLALTDAGWPDVKLYDGGLYEWQSLGHAVSSGERTHAAVAPVPPLNE
ncbi:sulfurtransferase [Streptomyces sp. NPDC127084]|uniref:sulfurtransferase n=1 Tax=Streptomyces sp. NPDC127084 TaxID=3347133 RepID=UPI003660D5CE